MVDSTPISPPFIVAVWLLRVGTQQVAAGGGEHLCSAVPSPDVTLDLTMDFERKSPAAVLRELR